MVMLTERDVKEQVKQYLDFRGIFHYPIAAGPLSKRGLPDRVMHLDGRVIYIECKGPGGRLSDHQKAFQAQCERDGIEYWVVDSLQVLIDKIGR